MAITRGDAPVATDSAPHSAPAAQRVRRPGWRDPRLWIGVVLVAGSVVAGARLLAAADDTVQVWAAAGDLGAGERLTEDDLVARRVRFDDDGGLAGYFTVADALPADLRLLQDVSAGDLVPRAALGAAADTGLVELPIAVEPEQVPSSVAAGAVVDVYVVAAVSPDAGTSTTDPADGPALSEVTVVDAPQLAESFGTSGRRQLVLAVPEEDAAPFFALLGTYDTAVLTVVRRS